MHSIYAKSFYICLGIIATLTTNVLTWLPIQNGLEGIIPFILKQNQRPNTIFDLVLHLFGLPVWLVCWEITTAVVDGNSI